MISIWNWFRHLEPKKHANYLDHIPVGGAKTTCLHFATGWCAKDDPKRCLIQFGMRNPCEIRPKEESHHQDGLKHLLGQGDFHPKINGDEFHERNLRMESTSNWPAWQPKELANSIVLMVYVQLEHDSFVGLVFLNWFQFWKIMSTNKWCSIFLRGFHAIIKGTAQIKQIRLRKKGQNRRFLPTDKYIYIYNMFFLH